MYRFVSRGTDGGVAMCAWSLLKSSLVLVMLWLTSVDVASANPRVALVVGSSDYRHASAIPRAVKDASDIAVAFERLGFTTIKVFNPSFDEFRQGIRNFNELTRAADIAVVFFSGYGMQFRGENWLLPIDADLRTESDILNEAVSLNVLMHSAGRASDLGMVILDASRNTSSVLQSRGDGATRAVTRGLARVEPAQRNIVVAYAAKDGTAVEDEGRTTSPYAAALLRYLEFPSLDVNLMFRKIRDDVMAQTKRSQQPFVYGSLPPKPIYLKAPSLETAGQSKDTAAPADDADEIVWHSIKESPDPRLFAQFLERFPASPNAENARSRLAKLEARPAPDVKPAVNVSRRLDRVDEVHQCDRLAASPLEKDLSKKVTGVELNRIDVAAAGPACEEAMRSHPETARFAFEAGRVALVRHDFASAIQLYEKASSLGSAIAMYDLGRIYAEGKIVAPDYEKARRWYEKAAGLNLPYAIADLAVLYENGQGGPSDVAAALSLYRKAAAAGDRASMTRIGINYELGLAVQRNYTEARRWLQKSAELGDYDAMKQLGKLYENGYGVPRNIETARRWYARAEKGRDSQ
jgi:uncharacterized protein